MTILYFLEDGAQPFVEFGNMIAGWEAWQEIGDFFEHKGEAFCKLGRLENYGGLL